MTEQMSIFDIKPVINEVEEFQEGDRVKVKKIGDISHQMSIEDEYILNHYTGKKGTVVGIHKGRVISYEVQMDAGDKTYFYAKELILLG